MKNTKRLIATVSIAILICAIVPVLIPLFVMAFIIIPMAVAATRQHRLRKAHLANRIVFESPDRLEQLAAQARARQIQQHTFHSQSGQVA